MNVKKDEAVIIPQILNYGSWDAVKWVRNQYGDEKVKQYIENPRRGIWFADVLNFWEQMFDIKIDPKLRKRAIFDVNPNYDYTVEDFK